MEDKQLPKNEFVREQIKEKPKNYKHIWMRLCTAALCGVVFALALCFTLLFLMPMLHRQWEKSVVEEVTEGTQQPVATEETEATQVQESTQIQVQKEPFSLKDYQKVQSELYAIGNQANHSIVTITSVVSDTDWFNNPYEREGQGSGAIIGDKSGKLLILTEKKVIKNASEINVTFSNDVVAPATLMKYDGNTGLAVLTVDKKDIEESALASSKVIEMGSANTVHKGSIVIALGSPLGTNDSILIGNITATNNEISTLDSNYSVYTTDIVANKNGSGILINTDGELVGVVMQDYNTASSSTLTAVGISELKPVMELLFADRNVPYVGVYASTVTDKIAEKYGIPKGVYVKEVAMDSPAMDAGLQSGDVILKIAGEEVASVGAFSSVVLGLTPDESYQVIIMREGTGGYKKISCEVKAGVLQ
ncbi:MAG: S1C family serine protease [Lachnospiraceae bacterium]|nr:S1C family serine protease [Agathobacter sp.]MDD6292153.1 S1C family serine protease [Lachnospiraceae bacterium]